MTTKHTPAPWTVEGDDIRESKDRCTIATVRCYGTHKLHTEKRANAQLIAAAPELLAALKAIVEHGEPIYPADWVRIKAAGIAAIAKAKGEA